MREPIPKKVKDAVLDEYEHRCAVCGGDRPHLHHIDEDASHNEISNLLPLCPNCHLRDQHNPTRMIEIAKLQLFRKYKDPAILKPQFHPIYTRQLFLPAIVENEESIHEIDAQSRELVELIQALEMGDFYSKRLTELILPRYQSPFLTLGSEPDHRYEELVRNANREYRAELIANREAAQAILVELLRYQSWANTEKGRT